MSAVLDRKSLWFALKGNVHVLEAEGLEAIPIESAWGQEIDQYPINALSVKDVGTLQIPVAQNVRQKFLRFKLM